MQRNKFTESTWRRHPWFRGLVGAIARCKNEKEIEDLLRDVGTLGELQAWSERFECAKQLARGFTQREVAANTGASTTTVNRVNRFLENGEGYSSVLKDERFHEAGEASGRMEKVEKTSEEKTESMLRKYL